MESFLSKETYFQDASSALKVLPHSNEAEIGIISTFLLDNSSIERYIDSLKVEDFFIFTNKIVFESVQKIYRKYLKIDFVMLQEDLYKRGVFDDIGGFNYILMLQENIYSLGFVDQYFNIVKDKSYLRSIISSSYSLIAHCYDQNEAELSTSIDKAEKMFFELSQSRIKKNFFQIDFWLKKTFEHLANVKTVFKGVTGVPTGYNVLDDMTTGLQPGDLVILAARPAMGKSAFALCLSKNASNFGFPVGFVSLEMSAEQLVLRLLSMESKIKLSSLRAGILTSDDWYRLTNAAASLSNMNLFIDDSPMQNISEIRTKARRLVAEKGVKLLVIDYLQLLSSHKKHESRQNEVSEISRFLKCLAKELSIPIIALSQLSRGVESRVDKRPILSDLRDSGAIEQDADLILFLYRDMVYNPETENNDNAELIIGKQRNGPTGTVNLKYEKYYTLFEDIEE